MYLNAERTSEWTTADTVSFDYATDGAPDMSMDHSLSESTLMAFLSDFRLGHPQQDPTVEGVEASGITHRPSTHHSTGSYLGLAKEEPAYVDDPYLGSTEQVADDWWLASDGRWYAPELHPDVHVEVAYTPEEPAPFSEPDSTFGEAPPDTTGQKARRPKLRGLLRSPATV